MKRRELLLGTAAVMLGASSAKALPAVPLKHVSVIDRIRAEVPRLRDARLDILTRELGMVSVRRKSDGFQRHACTFKLDPAERMENAAIEAAVELSEWLRRHPECVGPG